MFNNKDHTFAICAYKNSPFLIKCIESLKNQSIESNIIMITSTESDYIKNIADKYSIPLFVNKGKTGIAADWNFAYDKADTKLVTITHQDDIYQDEYVYNIISSANAAYKPLILFTDYGELRGSKIVYSNKLLKVKKLMLFPLRFKLFHKSKFVRRRILSFGSPICCPSVTYVKENIPRKLFDDKYFGAVDWQCWEKLSKLKGSFVYIHKNLLLHRIHEDSETTRIINNNNRSKEDLDMYKLFWPTSIAKLLEHFYNKGEDSNKLK